MLRSIAYLLNNYYKFTIMQIQIKGVVLEDNTVETNKGGQFIKERIVLLYQSGVEKNLKLKLPLDYKRKKSEDGFETFEGVLYFGNFKGRDFATLKVNEQSK